MFIEFSDRDSMCIDNRTQEQINQVLQEKFSNGHTVDLTDIPDDLWSADGERIQYWDEFLELSRDYFGKYENAALFACIEHDGSLDRFEEYYLGKFDSNAHYTQDYIESLYGLPDFLGPYVDWNRMFDDLDVTEINNYYFRCA